MLSDHFHFPSHPPHAAGVLPPTAHLLRRLRPRVPPVVIVALAVTALFSALIFYVSEGMFAQTITMQQRIGVLTEARVNALRIQGQVQQVQQARQAWLDTRDARRMPAVEQASRQALLHFGLLQGLLNAHPDLEAQARELGAALQADAGSPQARSAPMLAEGMDDSLLRALGREQAELTEKLSRQRVGTAVLVGLNLLFLAVLAVRAIRHFYEQERQQQALSTQALRLEAAVRERTNELNDLSTYLQKQSEEEKARLARELHDELGALLTAAKLDTAWLQGRNPGHDPERTERLVQLSLALDQALNIKRRVIENLQPSLLTHLGLGAALIWYVQQTCDSAGLTHDVQVPPEGVSVDAETGLALYRIVQEALNNTIRHARAREVRVTLRHTPEGHLLRIADDGIGIVDFRPDQLSHGLAGMRHRATALGGSFRVGSQPGQGTCIEVLVPHRQPQPDAPPAVTAESGEVGTVQGTAAPSSLRHGQLIKPWVTA